MKTLEDTPTRLMMEDKPHVLRFIMIALTLAFLIVGLFFQPIFETLSTYASEGQTGKDGWVIAQWMITASALFPIGVLVLVVKTRRVTFDLATGLILLERRGVLGRGVNEYPLAGLSGVGIQHSHTASSGRTSRAVLDFGPTREPVPLKPYFQSGQAPQQVASKINDWLMKHHHGIASMDAGGKV